MFRRLPLALILALAACSSSDLDGDVEVRAVGGQYAISNGSDSRVYFDAYPTGRLPFILWGQHLDPARSLAPGETALRDAAPHFEGTGIEDGRLMVYYWLAVTRDGERVPTEPVPVEVVVGR